VDQALVSNARGEHAVQCREQSALLRMQRRSVVDGTSSGYRTPRFLTFKQALELGGNVRKGKRGTKVYFVKQLQVRDDGADDNASTRLVPMMHEYTVFNVDQCENLPGSINIGKPKRFAILMRATTLPMNSCAQRAPTFAKATARPIICPAKISSRCRASARLRERIISTTWFSTN
jgi:hypothetical protein